MSHIRPLRACMLLALFAAVAPLAFGDSILLKGSDVPHEGVVVEVTNETITIRFPREEVVRVEPDGASAPAAQVEPHPEEEGKVTLTTEQFKELEESLRRMIREEIARAPSDAGATPAAPAAASPPPIPAGHVTGRYLRGGEPLPGCRVKLVRILESSSFLGLFRQAQEGAEFETTTGPDGAFAFEKIPVGRYSLRWQLPDETAWYRHLSDAADAEVKENETSALPDVDTRRRARDRE